MSMKFGELPVGKRFIEPDEFSTQDRFYAYEKAAERVAFPLKVRKKKELKPDCEDPVKFLKSDRVYVFD
jgi:hypothetical protein